jgi:hypothetical protein
VWALTMLALSFTRDSTVVVLAAVGWVVLAMRTRRSGLVLGTGVAVSVPAFALFPRHDPFFMLSKGAFVGAAALIAASINYTGLRIELVFIPSIAVALALAVARLLVAVRGSLSAHGSFSSPAAVNR